MDTPVRRIFLSHSSLDDDLAGAIAAALPDAEPMTISITQMSKELRSGDRWSDEIRTTLARSDAVLVLVTPNYVGRPWFYIEWAAAWTAGKPPHLLLIDVDRDDLPEVMRQGQVTHFDGRNIVRFSRTFVAAVTGLPGDDPRCINVANDLSRMIGAAQARWAQRKWENVKLVIAGGAAEVPERDLEWILKQERTTDLIDALHEGFAHPILAHRVALYLAAAGDVAAAVEIADLLTESAQLALYTHVVQQQLPHEALQVVSRMRERGARREAATIAVSHGLYSVAVEIADSSESGYDRRVIAEQLLGAGETALALEVVQHVERNHELTRFALTCIAAGAVGAAVKTAALMTVNKEIGRLAEALLDAGRGAEFSQVAARLDRNSEKKNLALYAIDAGNYDAAEFVAGLIETGDDLVVIAKHLYERGEARLALNLLPTIRKNEHRADFLAYLQAQGHPELGAFAAATLETSGERARFAEKLVDAGLLEDAAVIAAALERDDARQDLFWFAAARNALPVAEAAVAGMAASDERHRCETVLAAMAA